MSVTTLKEAIAINTVMRELFQMEGQPFTRDWDERPDRDSVRQAAVLLTKAAHKKLAAGLDGYQVLAAEFRTLTEDQEAELAELLGVE